MNKLKSKRKFIFAISAVLIIIVVSLIASAQITASSNLKKLNEKKQSDYTSYTAVLCNQTSLKAQPATLSASKLKLENGEQIQLTAAGDDWCKAVIYTDTKVISGYIPTSDITNITENSNNKQAQSTDKNEDVAPPPFTPETLEFNAAQYILDVGSTFDLSKTIKTDDLSAVSWHSTDHSVASLDGTKISAKSEGFSIITATAGAKTAVCSIEVRAINGHADSELKIKNAYGNNIDYHPSVLYFENGWNGYKYWMAHTPYEKCNDFWENPHIAASNDMVKWVTPKGFENPLEPVPEDYERGVHYNSDTELVYNTDTGRLECWWRNYNKKTMNVSLRRKTTTDGVHWTDAEDMLVFQLNKADFLSPAILYEDGIYKMWAINLRANYNIEYRESKDGKTWTNARIIEVEYEDPKYINWHLDVIHTPKGYEMDISAFLKGTNDHTVMPLFYTYSPDNVTYTKVRMMLQPRSNTGKWDNRGIYRSCLLYADGEYHLFYSGLNQKTGPVGIGLISGNNVFHMN